MSTMQSSIGDNTKKRPEQTGTFIGVRLQPEALERLDEWLLKQGKDRLSRPEAIRRLIDLGLEAARKGIAPITPTEAEEVR